MPVEWLNILSVVASFKYCIDKLSGVSLPRHELNRTNLKRQDLYSSLQVLESEVSCYCPPAS